jgi:hypothetical protein
MRKPTALMIELMVSRLSPWTGPVERRDPATYRTQSQHLTWRCKAPLCGRFAMDGAYLTGFCNFCRTPRHPPNA